MERREGGRVLAARLSLIMQDDAESMGELVGVFDETDMTAQERFSRSREVCECVDVRSQTCPWEMSPTPITIGVDAAKRAGTFGCHQVKGRKVC